MQGESLSSRTDVSRETSLIILDSLEVEQRELLDLHLSLLIAENEKSNLTRIVNEEQAQLLHVEDSLQGLAELNLAPSGLYVDLGSGGGFPGIPLAVLTQRDTLLVDSVGKKTAALDRIIASMGLSSKIHTYNGRAEELALEMSGKASVVTARALTSLPSLLELASPLLELGGWLVCFKAQISEDELDHAISLEEKLGMALRSDRRFYLSDEETYRSILVFEKVSEPTVKLPRRPGMAQKRPY